MKRFASIDIGSNTVRLLILESASNGNFREIGSARRITRLGEGMDTEGRLLPKRMQDTLDVLAEFRQMCKTFGDIPIRAVATSAVREAENKTTFLELAKQHTGFDIEVISWEEEARLTLKGVFWKIEHHNRHILTFDIGGGSTEFILSEGKEIAACLSTSLGTVRLTEKYISRHPVPDQDYQNLLHAIRKELASVKAHLWHFSPDLVIGTAGTVTTLAALDGNVYPYDPEKIHGAVLPLERIQGLQDDLKAKSIAERLLLKSLEKGREDLIVAGTAITLETLRTFDCSQLLVSEYGLREGIILKALQS